MAGAAISAVQIVVGLFPARIPCISEVLSAATAPDCDGWRTSSVSEQVQVASRPAWAGCLYLCPQRLTAQFQWLPVMPGMVGAGHFWCGSSPDFRIQD